MLQSRTFVKHELNMLRYEALGIGNAYYLTLMHKTAANTDYQAKTHFNKTHSKFYKVSRVT